MAALCLLAYLPAINNGFISDDVVMLEWARTFQSDPEFLLRMAPDVFRLTTYLSLGLLQALFGYRYEFFYGFTILIHVVNCLLLYRLVVRVTGARGTAAIAAVLFAVVQNPQEAVMWLAAMAYVGGGLCVLGTLLFWLRDRHLAASLVFLVGLFTTESALVTLALVPLMEMSTTGKFTLKRRHGYLLIPAFLFLLVFVATFSGNYMVTPGTYRPGLHSLPVLAVSLHKLMFPWFYLAALLVLVSQRRHPVRGVGPALLWTVIALGPFLFLTYQNHAPSRQLYVPTMGVVAAIAIMLNALADLRLRQAFVVLFVIANASYLWLVKDPQFETRAAPTVRLKEFLGAHPPARLAITDFPLNPWIAKMTSRMVPGWEPAMLEVEGLGSGCPECSRIRWDEQTALYRHVGAETEAAAVDQVSSR